MRVYDTENEEGTNPNNCLNLFSMHKPTVIFCAYYYHNNCCLCLSLTKNISSVQNNNLRCVSFMQKPINENCSDSPIN